MIASALAVTGVLSTANCSTEVVLVGHGGSAQSSTVVTSSVVTTVGPVGPGPEGPGPGPMTVSASSGIGGCGSFMTGNPQCDDCVDVNCCAENLACDVATDCDNLTVCLATCATGDMACQMACAMMFPNGQADYQARAMCISVNCTMECTNTGICDSGLTFGVATCDVCLSTSCCAEADACSGGMNGMNAGMVMACIADCNKMPPGPLCQGFIGCLTSKCSAECM